MNIQTGKVTLQYVKNNHAGKPMIIRKFAQIEKEEDRLIITFPFDEYLKNEIKALDGARWLGSPDQARPRKAWAVKSCHHNHFQLAYLMGQNPYAPYNGELPPFMDRRRKPDGSNWFMTHQNTMASHFLTRHQCILAGETGVAKTLAAIGAMEQAGIPDYLSLWLGPRSALDAVKYEFWKWSQCEHCGKLGMHHRWEDHALVDNKIPKPRFATYEELKTILKNWNKNHDQTYKLVVMDECHKLKTPTSQRTQAAQYLADSMRDEYNHDAMIWMMSGTPAPKSPADWWSLCNISQPGFIREGNIQKFTSRLARVEYYEGTGGGKYPKLENWWDDENKCGKCGRMEDDDNHHDINQFETWYHPYRKSVNEVQLLYERMRGLVLVVMKKDVLDLPEKQYRRIICKPSASTLRAANLIAKTAISAIKAMTLIRELSDGFQYTQIERGTEVCPRCLGKLKINQTVDLDDPDNPLDSESLTKGHRAIWENDPEGHTYNLVGFKDEPLRLGEIEIDCNQCGGTGEVPNYEREAVQVDCPKDAAVVDLLEQYEDEGRIVFAAGFTESIDRLTKLCIANSWPVIRLDGRGYYSNLINMGGTSGVDYLKAFDDKAANPKIAWIIQPGAGGMGITLTASSVLVYYSNTFKFEDRAQSEDRIHRPGADHNRGCMIIDLIHLPQDIYVLDNLKRKRDLQSMTLGELAAATDKYTEEFVRAV